MFSKSLVRTKLIFTTLCFFNLVVFSSCARQQMGLLSVYGPSKNSAPWLENYCWNYIFNPNKHSEAQTYLNELAKDESLDEAQDDAIVECQAAIDLFAKNLEKKGDLKLAKETMVKIREKMNNKKYVVKKDPLLKTALKNTIGFVRDNQPKPNDDFYESLILLSEVAEYLDDPKNSPAETTFLKKVIRDKPQTDLAVSAYDQLFERVHFGYTGSSGDKTPDSIQAMLGRYRQLALIKK